MTNDLYSFDKANELIHKKHAYMEVMYVGYVQPLYDNIAWKLKPIFRLFQTAFPVLAELLAKDSSYV